MDRSRRGGGRPPTPRSAGPTAAKTRAGEWKRTGTARRPAPSAPAAPARRPEPAPRNHRHDNRDDDDAVISRSERAPRAPAPAERGWKPAPSRARARAPERETLPPSRREPPPRDRDEEFDRPLPVRRRAPAPAAPVRGRPPASRPARDDEYDREPARSGSAVWRPARGQARAPAPSADERDHSLIHHRDRDRDRDLSRGRDRGVRDDYAEREPAPRDARAEPREAPRAAPRRAARPPERDARQERPAAASRAFTPAPTRASAPRPVASSDATVNDTAATSWLVSPPSLIPGEYPAPSFSVAPLVPSAPVAKIAPAPSPAATVDIQAQLQAKLAPLMQILGHQFKDITILHHALTHSSSKGQAGASQYDNERMEFLGDSVLGLAMAEWLYEKYPQGDEGLMSKLKSHLVSTKNMAIIAADNRIQDFMILGGSGVDAARRNERLICSALEAVTGAVFLDAGFMAARGMLRRIFYEQMRNLDARETMEEDAKSTLQEYLQTNFHVLPRHESFLHDDAGEKIYITVIKAKSIVLGEGMGKSKKDSQQAAAKRSLERLRTGLVKIK